MTKDAKKTETISGKESSPYLQVEQSTQEIQEDVKGNLSKQYASEGHATKPKHKAPVNVSGGSEGSQHGQGMTLASALDQFQAEDADYLDRATEPMQLAPV